MAEKIKALKAAHSIEPAPQRAQQKHSSAEEPVTARIRRRTEEVLPATDPGISSYDAPPAEAEMMPQSPRNSSLKSHMTFQERIVMERLHKDEEISLP